MLFFDGQDLTTFEFTCLAAAGTLVAGAVAFLLAGPARRVGLVSRSRRDRFGEGNVPLVGGPALLAGALAPLAVLGFPVSPGQKAGCYALEVQGDSMMPLYRDGDVLIVEPGAQVRRGDRVVVKTRDGEVMAKVLARQTARTIELASLNPDHPGRSLDMAEVDWIARIIWASQ